MNKRLLIVIFILISIVSFACKPEQVETYKVNYNGNGNDSGSVPIDSNSYPEGSTVTVLGNTGGLEKVGYSFIGWNSQSDGRGNIYIEGVDLRWHPVPKTRQL